MRGRGLSVLVGLALLASGCGKAVKRAAGDPSQPAAAGDGGAAPELAAAAPRPTAEADGWIGKWVGVEGLALDIARGDAPGHYLLAVTLLDGTQRYDGIAAPGGIAFQRDGKPALVHRAKGAETGLKWLAGKQDCLMIAPGEGFCRS